MSNSTQTDNKNTDNGPAHEQTGKDHTAPKTPLARRFPKWLPLAAIAALFFAFWQTGLLEQLSLSNMIMHRQAMAGWVEANWLVALLAYMALYAALVAISFPGASFLTIVSGFLFGGLVGGFATIIAATCGAIIIFLAARSSFGEALQKRAGGFVAEMLKGFHEDAFQYLLILRLAPIFPFWVINIVPALCNMALMPYALATLIGIIPGTLAYSYMGAGLDSVIAAQESANPGCAAKGSCVIEPGALITGELLLAIVGLALISILPLAIKKWRQHKPADGQLK